MENLKLTNPIEEYFVKAGDKPRAWLQKLSKDARKVANLKLPCNVHMDDLYD